MGLSPKYKSNIGRNILARQAQMFAFVLAVLGCADPEFTPPPPCKAPVGFINELGVLICEEPTLYGAAGLDQWCSVDGAEVSPVTAGAGQRALYSRYGGGPPLAWVSGGRLFICDEAGDRVSREVDLVRGCAAWCSQPCDDLCSRTDRGGL